MYKKTIWIIFFLLFISNLYAQENTETAGSMIEKPFGSFLLPNDWVEITKYSKNGKFFYSHKSEDISLNMTNISIEKDVNRYLLEEHMTFRYAIQRQLLMQFQQIGAANLSGSGTYTKHDYPLYIFTIKHKDRTGNKDVITIQYYIIGNKKHILIHLTDSLNGNILNADEIAMNIADSFVWAE
jgi:hypothetical protein